MINRKIAISDIHGCSMTFKALLEHLQFGMDDVLYLLGDYVDRGPDSKGVIDHIWKLKNDGFSINCLRGNHEHMMLKASMDGNTPDHWIRNGGDTTMTSFGTNNPHDIPSEYFNWIKKLPFYVEVDQYFLVHAGLNFKSENPLGALKDMLWIRDWYDYLDKEWLQEKIIIHGHTTMKRDDIESMLREIKSNQVIDIDNGCVYNDSLDKGRLCAFDMTNQQLFFQENIG